MYVIGDPTAPDHCDPTNPTMFDVYMFEMYPVEAFMDVANTFPSTWRCVVGTVVPIPTYPEFATYTADDPVSLKNETSAPVPNCWTVSAVPVLVFPTIRQLLVLRIVFADGLNWLNVAIQIY